MIPRRLLLATLLASAVFTAHAAPMAAIGALHTLLLDDERTVWSVGEGLSGQLGNGAYASSSSPVRVMGAAVAIASGANFGLAMDAAGKVWGWGDNSKGQLGAAAAAVATPVALSGIAAMRAVSAGGEHSLAIDANGGGWAWGSNKYGQLGDGRLIDSRPTPTLISGLSPVKALAGGLNHSLALDTGGNVWAWGSNAYGQISQPSYINRNATLTPQQVAGVSNVIAIAGGGYHSLALKADGTVWAWGDNAFGQLGDGTRVGHYKPGIVSNLSGIVAIGAGRTQSYAVDKQGNVWSWGQGDYPGAAFVTDPTNPALIGSGIAVGSGAAAMHNALIRSDGTVQAWGVNRSGQLGDGTFVMRQRPALVVNATLDGLLDLSPAVPNAPLPPDEIPPFLTKISNDGVNVTATIKYDAGSNNQTGNVYAVGLVKAGSKLLAQGSAFAGADDVAPVVLTRTGWKQSGGATQTEPLATGILAEGNSTFALYNPAVFDTNKEFGILCVGYASSAKGLIRPVVTGNNPGQTGCPPIQVTPASFVLTASNNNNAALVLSGNIQPNSEHVGQTMNIYVWAQWGELSWMKDKENWTLLTSPRAAAFSKLIDGTPVTVPIANGLNVTGIPGTRVYVGYGSSEKDMLDNARYGEVYQIQQ